MTQEERDWLIGKIENEGLQYAMRDYSDWLEIKDPEFHRLLKKYRDSADALEEYIFPEDTSDSDGSF